MEHKLFTKPKQQLLQTKVNTRRLSQVFDVSLQHDMVVVVHNPADESCTAEGISRYFIQHNSKQNHVSSLATVAIERIFPQTGWNLRGLLRRTDSVLLRRLHLLAGEPLHSASSPRSR